MTANAAVIAVGEVAKDAEKARIVAEDEADVACAPHTPDDEVFDAAKKAVAAAAHANEALSALKRLAARKPKATAKPGTGTPAGVAAAKARLPAVVEDARRADEAAARARAAAQTRKKALDDAAAAATKVCM